MEGAAAFEVVTVEVAAAFEVVAVKVAAVVEVVAVEVAAAELCGYTAYDYNACLRFTLIYSK